MGVQKLHGKNAFRVLREARVEISAGEVRPWKVVLGTVPDDPRNLASADYNARSRSLTNAFAPSGYHGSQHGDTLPRTPEPCHTVYITFLSGLLLLCPSCSRHRVTPLFHTLTVRLHSKANMGIHITSA